MPCFAITWLKYTCNKGILSIQIMGKCIFVLFRNLSPFNWRAKLVIYYFLLLFCLTKQLRYATYDLETCSDLGSIKHTYISMVRQTTSTSKVVQSFSFFFLLSGAQYRIINNNINNSNNNNNNNNNKLASYIRRKIISSFLQTI